ncbi:MAG: sulfotransferase domain-containing protein [Phormidesmis sp.]
MLDALKKELKTFSSYITAEQRSLPDFFIVGTQKGGTTSLYAYLCQHPNVIAASDKEVHYFESPENRKKGLRWYKSHFPTLSEKQAKQAITGEATPLMYSLHAPRLVYEAASTTKLIFLLRNPTERAFSHYKHNTRKPDREALTFSEAIRAEDSRIEQDIRRSRENPLYNDSLNRRFSYVHRGFYADQINWWRQFFPTSQMLIEESEYFYAKPQACLDKVTDFLDLPQHKFDCQSRHNTGDYSEAMSECDRQYLQALYEEPNKQLFDLIGRKLWVN